VEGFEGLAAGSKVLTDMVATFWDDCYPPKKRLRGRMNVFFWWQEKLLSWLKNRPGGEPAPAAERAAVTQNVKKLDEALGELLPDFPPMRELIAVLDRLPGEQSIQKEGSAEQPAPNEQGGGEKKEPASEPPAASVPSVPEDAAASRKMLAQSALTFAGMGGTENPADPWVWKASRMAAWISVKGLPPAQGGQTMIPAPDSTIKPALLTCLSDGKLLEAARSAEEHFTGAIFWLDLQRIIAKALEGLGDDFASALEVVRGETLFLLSRLRGLEQLSFSDSTPFADPETRAWIASLNSGGGKPDPQESGDDPVGKALEDADSRFSKKEEAAALDLISRAIGETPDGRGRLRLRLGQMYLLCRAGRFGMASALADEILAEIDARGLETWDPSLMVKALLAGREAFVGAGGEENVEKARKLAARISRIRPSAALNLTL
jgi:type VI secretion system protein VasJ